MSVWFPAIFVGSLLSSYSLRVNRRPAATEKVSTLHFDASPPSQAVV